MDKKTTLKGMWWVKGNEDDKFIGNLTCGAGYAPILEIFPKEYDFGSPKVPNGSTLYGDVFDDSRKVRAVTLLECTSSDSWGSLEVGAFLYSQRFVHADCVAIGMLLDDDEIAQVQAPQEIYLTCPGLDEYSYAHTVEYVWKDNIPPGRAYRTNDLERIVYTQPEPIVIEIDIGTITILLGQSSTPRDISSQYFIHISLANPTPKDEVISLIYSQLLWFLSIITGTKEYIARHSLTIGSKQARHGSLSIELNYGQITHSAQDTEYSILQTLLLGSEENMSKFATLFPKWRKNFKFVEGLAFHYMQMIEQRNEVSLLRSFSHIEEYVLQRLLKKNQKGMHGILSKVINYIANYFQCSNHYGQHFPTDRIEHIAEQLANFRHNRIHLKSDKECIFTPADVYAYINLILRSIFLIEMEYPSEDIDNVIQHWYLWNQIKEK